jgi:hypothetical protein
MAAGAANHTMHKLETFLSQWRQAMSAAPHLTAETLDELESHLRERIAELTRSGIAESEACERAAAEFGPAATIAAEFRKGEVSAWLPVRIVVAMTVVVALAVAIFLLIRTLQGNGGGVLLAIHVFTVTLGYSTTLLLGVLGACFVLQRAFGGFSERRLAWVGRATFSLGILATVFTTLGVILAMFWSHREWGRFWGWDAKEIGALCVVLWMSGFLIAHQFRRITDRGLLLACVLGSNLVLLAWFGHRLVPGFPASALPVLAWALLLAAFVGNLFLTGIGLAPACILRRPKA